MLTLAIPVSKSDLDLLVPFVNACRHLGAINHRIIFFPTYEVSGLISASVEAMKEICQSVSVIPLKSTPQGGWPKACNQHFTEVVPHMLANGTPWYWCELDVTPLKHGWADMLETEYRNCKMPFMGSVVQTRRINPETKKMEQSSSRTHMTGCGIYPADFGRPGMPYGNLWKFAPQMDIGFDVYQGDEIRRFVHDSPNMQHMWGTVNYRELGGQILCDQKANAPEGSDHSGPVLPNAIVCHGCKDGSLAKLVTTISMPEAPVFLEVPQETPKYGVYDFKVVPGATNYKMDPAFDVTEDPMVTPAVTVATQTDEVAVRLSRIEEKLDRLLAVKEAPVRVGMFQDLPEEDEDANAPDAPKAAEPPKEPRILTDPTALKAQEMLQNGNVRLVQMAAKLQMGTQPLRKLLEENGFRVTRGGWVHNEAA